MLRIMHHYRLELKYALLSMLLLAGLLTLTWLGVLAGFEHQLSQWMQHLTKWGVLGMFAIAYVSNLTLVMPLPYGLPLFTLVLYAESHHDALLLGLAAGLGAGFGATMAYSVANSMLSQIDHAADNRMVRFVRRVVDRYPRTIPVIVWLASATPAPEGMITTSLALVRYPWRTIVALVATGKVCGNLVMATLYFYAAGLFTGQMSESANFGGTLLLIVVCLGLFAYQAEKVQLARGDTRQRQQPTVVSGRAETY
ncbi:MAG: hypothetical protein K8S97_09425 [Anaerolineae bacterium]|nr:hypothetical protein [Anaerolineae bacterium]